MKRNFLVLGVLAMVWLAGCAGKQSATVSMDDQTANTANETGEVIKFHSTGLGLFTSPPCPDQMGRLIESRANAKLTEAIAQQVKTGQASNIVGEYVGVIINQDPYKDVYVYHPSRNEIRKIKSGNHSIFLVTEIPDHISVRFAGEKNNQRMKIWKVSKIYNGIKVDFGARIES